MKIQLFTMQASKSHRGFDFSACVLATPHTCSSREAGNVEMHCVTAL